MSLRRSVVKIVIVLCAGTWLTACAGALPGGNGGVAPAVATLPATAIKTDGAVLNGTVDPNGSAAVAWFEIGTDPDPSSWTATFQLEEGAGTRPRPVRETVRGLNPYATYYYRAVARNGFGLQRGEIRTFPTGEYYVAVGDSVTAGSHGNNFESRLGELLAGARGYPNVVANLGISGATAPAGVGTISFALATYPWAKYYLVMFGTNDARLPRPVPSGSGRRPGDLGYAGSYKESLRKIVSAIRSAGKVPCLAKAPFAASRSVDVAALREYGDVVDELVAEERLPVPPPDFFAYFQAHPDGLTDGLHPNRSGYDAMAQLWLEALTGVRRR